jgi:hypothetical protein
MSSGSYTNVAFAVVDAFFKKNWRSALLTVVVAVAGAWFNHTQALNAETIVDMNKSHQAEIDQINKARGDEEAQYENELKNYQQRLVSIQQEYDVAVQQLQKQETTERTDIVKKYGKDADGLTTLLANKLGFVIVTQVNK